MSIKILLLVCILASLLLQTSIVSFPIFIIFSIILYMLFPDIDSVFIIFLGALTLDILQVKTIGFSAIFILFVFIGINVLQRAFNTRDYKSIFVTVFLATVSYSLIFSYTINWLFYILIFSAIFLLTQFFYGRIING